MSNATSNQNQTSISGYGDARCKNSTRELFNLTTEYEPFVNFCAVPLYISWNTTDSGNVTEWEEGAREGKTPLGFLRECCTEAEGDISFRGPTDCTAVCNVTDGTARDELQDCIAARVLHASSGFCAGKGEVDDGVGRIGVPFDGVVGGGVGGYLALGAVVGYVVGFL